MRAQALAATCLAVAWLGFPAAHAGPAECNGIAQAFAALSEIPGFAETATTAQGPASEAIVLGDTAYFRLEQGWKAKALPRARRVGYFFKGFDEGALEACETLGPEARGGVMMRRYRFVLRLPVGTVEGKLVVGLDDGLIREADFGSLNMRLRYDGLMPPN